jgi:beta-lactamase superfamily II metal-dependent hydrolase
MQVHFINVGYGEAILVTRGGYSLLIDGGRPGRRNEAPGCIRVAEY